MKYVTTESIKYGGVRYKAGTEIDIPAMNASTLGSLLKPIEVQEAEAKEIIETITEDKKKKKGAK